MPQAHQLPYWLLTARCPKHGEMRAAVSHAALAANLEALCEALDASLPLNDPGRLELAEIVEELAALGRPIRERVPVEVQQDYYERLIERNEKGRR